MRARVSNLPKVRVRLRMAADIPVFPGLPKPNILSELLSSNIHDLCLDVIGSDVALCFAMLARELGAGGAQELA